VKVVVTGGGGKFGRWLVRELTSGELGATAHDLTVFDLNCDASDEAAIRVSGNILDLEKLTSTFKGADAVIHCAGFPTNGLAPDDITFSVNSSGAFNVHEAARRNNVRRVVTLSSEAVLGWAPGAWTRELLPLFLPIDETHPLRPQDAYGLSKVAGEEIAKSFHTRTGMETICLRPPWIITPEELQTLASTKGVKPTRFALFHYIDVRDLARLCRAAIETSHPEHECYFAGAGETIVAEPLCSLYPRLVPGLKDLAASLTGKMAPVTSEKAINRFDWSPRHFWRELH
jgi:UDP-glucose 4-epimerase